MGMRMLLSHTNTEVAEEGDLMHMTLVTGCHIPQDCECRTKGEFEEREFGIFYGLIFYV